MYVQIDIGIVIKMYTLLSILEYTQCNAIKIQLEQCYQNLYYCNDVSMYILYCCENVYMKML